MGRDPGVEGRMGAPEGVRRMPGGGGIGRPVALSGRPGGGGIGRPVALSGGRRGVGVSPSPVGRWVGRMVVGPSGVTVRTGGALGAAAARERTKRGAASSLGAALSVGGTSLTGAGTASTGLGVGTGAGVTSTTRLGAGAGALDSASARGRAALGAFAGSAGGVSRRSPSASTRRRIRSAWASSMDADGLEAPMPNFWAIVSNSLLVSPSSLESSCTRIFFSAKTIPHVACVVCARTATYSFTTTPAFGPSATSALSAVTSVSPTGARSARVSGPTARRSRHGPSAQNHAPRPSPRPTYHCPSERPTRTNAPSSRLARQTTQVRTGATRPPLPRTRSRW